jgi:hypothetical protein
MHFATLLFCFNFFSSIPEKLFLMFCKKWCAWNGGKSDGRKRKNAAAAMQSGPEQQRQRWLNTLKRRS